MAPDIAAAVAVHRDDRGEPASTDGGDEHARGDVVGGGRANLDDLDRKAVALLTADELRAERDRGRVVAVAAAQDGPRGGLPRVE